MIRWVHVLYVVRQRQVRQTRPVVLFEEPDAGVEHEQRQRVGVHVWQWPADPTERVVDAILLERTAVCALRGETEVAIADIHSIAELPAEFFLGGDYGRFDAGL